MGAERRMWSMVVIWIVGLVLLGFVFVSDFGMFAETESGPFFDGPVWDRMVSFVIGGIVGAAAAVWTRRWAREWVEHGADRLAYRERQRLAEEQRREEQIVGSIVLRTDDPEEREHLAKLYGVELGPNG